MADCRDFAEEYKKSEYDGVRNSMEYLSVDHYCSAINLVEAMKLLGEGPWNSPRKNTTEDLMLEQLLSKDENLLANFDILHFEASKCFSVTNEVFRKCKKEIRDQDWGLVYCNVEQVMTCAPVYKLKKSEPTKLKVQSC